MSYSPILGRWVQQDPLGYVDGTNLYGYERDNPTTMVDPLGLQASPVTAAKQGMKILDASSKAFEQQAGAAAVRASEPPGGHDAVWVAPEKLDDWTYTGRGLVPRLTHIEWNPMGMRKDGKTYVLVPYKDKSGNFGFGWVPAE